MAYPKNPDEIVLKNRFYPNGLTEKDVYEYYVKNRQNLLEEVKRRDLMVYIFVEENKPVVRKKLKGRPIQLTPKNYEEIITGRTVSIHNIMNHMEDIAIVDIDVDDFRDAKTTTMDVFDSLEKAPFIDSVSIRYTGKTSFHLYCELVKKIRVDSIRTILENHLTKSGIGRQYTIQKTRQKNIPNIDLYRNVKGASFIALHSLSIWGLKCMEVKYNQVKSFNYRSAIV